MAPRASPGQGPTAARPALLLAALLLVGGVCYGLLGLGDLLLGRWLDRQASQINAPARAIEARRALEQDQAQGADARAQGDRTMLFPALFETGVFRQMAQAQGGLPLGAQADALLLYCNEGAGLVRYRSDRFGLRNDDAIWDEAVIDVALLGDSYVQGACVAAPDTLAGRLQATGRRVVSLGMAGNNAIHHAAVARAFLPALQARFAVLVFYPNDNQDEHDSVFRALAFDPQPGYVRREGARRLPAQAQADANRLLALAEAEADRQRLAEAADKPRPAPWYQRVGRHLALPHLRRVLRQAVLQVTEAGLAWSSRLAIDTLVELCRPPACQPVLAYIPNSEFWRPDARAPAYRAALQAHAATHGAALRWVDAGPALAPLGLQAYASHGPHLSPAGYQAVATAIQGELLP